MDFLKMLDLALSQIYTRVFHLWKSVALPGLKIFAHLYPLFFYSRVFARLARYTCVDLEEG